LLRLVFSIRRHCIAIKLLIPAQKQGLHLTRWHRYNGATAIGVARGADYQRRSTDAGISFFEHFPIEKTPLIYPPAIPSIRSYLTINHGILAPRLSGCILAPMTDQPIN
jgi:hypothetical protein